MNANAAFPPAGKPRPAANILIAEDERDVRELLVLLLELESYTVTAVGDGKAAVQAAQTSD